MTSEEVVVNVAPMPIEYLTIISIAEEFSSATDGKTGVRAYLFLYGTHPHHWVSIWTSVASRRLWMYSIGRAPGIDRQKRLLD